MSTKSKKAKPAADANAVPETREQKLVRLANARVNKACKAISLVGNLAAYKPTLEVSAEIMAALANACDGVEKRLTGVQKQATTFSLALHPAR